ncbi:MAG: hypothetical protein JJ992_30065, partial [Planctomycetes bacterium]|nr:hypothetical protein [Planctomycetota bacterium]
MLSARHDFQQLLAVRAEKSITVRCVSLFNNRTMSLPQNRHPGKTDDVTSSPFSIQARCSVLTGVGRSAVAVIAVEGRDAS